MTVFQERLRLAVERSGRSQREVSTAAGLGPGYVNDMLAKADRSPTLDNARALARVLRVEPSWLMGVASPESVPQGFSENQAAPWIVPAAPGQRGDLEGPRRALIAALAPSAQNAATFVASTNLLAFGLLAGDVLIVDLKARAKDGDLVLATVADLYTGEASTIVRRLGTPYLLSGDPTDKTPLHVVDGARTVVMGPIVASFRAPALTSRP